MQNQSMNFVHFVGHRDVHLTVVYYTLKPRDDWLFRFTDDEKKVLPLEPCYGLLNPRKDLYNLKTTNGIIKENY